MKSSMKYGEEKEHRATLSKLLFIYCLLLNRHTYVSIFLVLLYVCNSQNAQLIFHIYETYIFHVYFSSDKKNIKKIDKKIAHVG